MAAGGRSKGTRRCSDTDGGDARKHGGHVADRRKTGFARPQFDEATCSIRTKCRGADQSDVRDRFKNASSVEQDGEFLVLRYPSKEHALVDMKANRRPGGSREEGKGKYMDNKFIVTNLSYKETEESIAEEFGRYGEIEKIVIQRNKEGMSVGKAVITFKGRTVIGDGIVMSSKPIYIEKIRKPLENKTRFFVGRLDKSLSIVAIRKVLADNGCKPKDIRVIYSENKRNKGYGFIEYGSEGEALAFASRFGEMKKQLGAECFYEYSNEKAGRR